MNPTTEKDDERRTDVRRKVLKGALVSFNNGYSSFECIVRNQSSTGCRLAFAETFALPATFWLLVGDERPVRAQIKWRTMNAVGVELAA